MPRPKRDRDDDEGLPASVIELSCRSCGGSGKDSLGEKCKACGEWGRVLVDRIMSK